MFFDAHIHLNFGQCDSPNVFLQKTALVNVTGGNIFSPAPFQTMNAADGDYRWEARIEKVLSFCAEATGFNPFFYFDPTAPDAIRQVEFAAAHGIKGYKIICSSFYPEATLPACKAIAETGLPVMFHCGILNGGRDLLSGKFNKPIEFESLFSVKGLRFSLAHHGWPWIDEYLGIVSKALCTYDPEFGNEMFTDITPGPHGIYREDALRKLYLAGYNVKHNVIWGTDCQANDYESKIALCHERRDCKIMKHITADNDIAQAEYLDTPPDLSDIFELATYKNSTAFNRATPSAK